MSILSNIGSSLGLGSPKPKIKQDGIILHLLSKGKITSMDAINLFGATRLSAVIFNLRKRGVSIVSVDSKINDRFGKQTTFATYTLVGTQENIDLLKAIFEKGTKK